MKLIKQTVKHSLIIGDVHSSPRQLKDLLDKAPIVSQYFFLGDLVDRGPDPNEVIEVVHNMVQIGHTTVIMGNHDWKFVRLFNGSTNVTLKDEQKKTLEQMTERSKELFMEIFKDPIIGVWDSDQQVMLGHAAACRPLRFFEKQAQRTSEEKGYPFSAQDIMDFDEIEIHKNGAAKFLYGIVENNETDENGYPKRQPITKDPDDDMDGWIFIHGHTHAKNLFPENGNKNVVCLDWACGEEGGKLAGLSYATRSSVNEGCVFFTE